MDCQVALFQSFSLRLIGPFSRDLRVAQIGLCFVFRLHGTVALRQGVSLRFVGSLLRDLPHVQIGLGLGSRLVRLEILPARGRRNEQGNDQSRDGDLRSALTRISDAFLIRQRGFSLGVESALVLLRSSDRHSRGCRRPRHRRGSPSKARPRSS